ncbi:helix-turn-helix domain-containing protein [Flavobacterium sp. JP2137]|uniref:helix-turn-helix domain-containing protein n=1 Tax=Flavobacterium sp. JP2137 TaxID=3414510 RepID=UPI003D3013E2
MTAKNSTVGNHLLSVENGLLNPLASAVRFSDYVVLFLTSGEGIFYADNCPFVFSGATLLFATPLQVLRLEFQGTPSYTMLRFHSDFYCIETHREEVACNGLLFNNIYIRPTIAITAAETVLFQQLIAQLSNELLQNTSEMVLRAYLQLILAKASSIKLRLLDQVALSSGKDEQMERFRLLLDAHFLSLHQPMDYAELLDLNAVQLRKKSLKYFGKTPSQLIQDRLILEAKKKLHLTTASIKEIAFQMAFSDAYYFSRFFKKHCGISPAVFRQRGGISEVAYLSMEKEVSSIVIPDLRP